MGNDKYQTYAIQLTDLTLERALTQLISPEDEAYTKWNEIAGVNGTDSASCSFQVKHTNYDSEDKTITVGCKVESYARDEENSPVYHFDLELLGLFEVDDKKFPIQFVEDWAKRNAPMVLYPYVREHIYNMAIRAGIRKMILPLLQIPTFKVQNDMSEEKLT